MNFSPAKGLAEHWIALAAPRNDAIGKLARDAYRDLRIDYQRRFAEGEILKLQKKQRIGYTSADILYLLGAALAFAALTYKVVFPDAADVSSWIDFLAITAFVAGLMYAILDNASLAETSKVRYEDYVRALNECDGELKAEGAHFPEIVRRIERVVLGELSDFCQSASRISYRL